MKKAMCLGAVCTLAILWGQTFAAVMDPFDTFSVYSLGDLGTSSSLFQASFTGPVGVAQSAYMQSSYISAPSGGTGSLHVGGDLNVRYSQQFSGNVEAGGNIQLNGVTIAGNVSAGGNVGDYDWNGATVRGTAQAAGAINFSSRVSVQSAHSGIPYSPEIDLAAASAYYLATSRSIGAKTPTGSVVNQYGNLTFTAVKGINVIDIDQQTLHDAWAFTITGPADATVLINVLNAAVDLDNTTWVYQGGIAESSVVLNMPLATSLTLSQGNAVNILAPLATTQFQQGTVNGQLVVGNLYGGGVVTGGSFNDHALPEPATLSLLALGTLAIMRRRRKQPDSDPNAARLGQRRCGALQASSTMSARMVSARNRAAGRMRRWVGVTSSISRPW